MSAKILDGKQHAANIRTEVKAEVALFTQQHGRAPGLAVVLVGDYPPSVVYVRNKQKAAKEMGMHSEDIRLPATTSEADVLRAIDELNRRDDIDGMLVQLPVPHPHNGRTYQLAIDPSKDVDGLHPLNAGKLLMGQESLVPGTPAGVMELLRREQIEIESKNAVVMGRSDIVGKPLAILLMQANATVTIAHSKTKPLRPVTREADILVAAIGKARFVNAEMVKPGAVVIDVGINRMPDPMAKDGFRIVGDVDFKEVSEVAGAITPVPGGVGPLTIAMLLKNTLTAGKRRVG